mmetsp:Transcript_52617/g.87365  ORF Transcript_52617/g.87365 Transcript_52617/m.87365 type:complete len:350 (+) Transcript_52617:170-1219(+)|eukprot:CAMPEP_0119318762 /NCGR_PEP_ID=MMETSP1333-20130426/47559_1 /TAXON_ID=418940 /ORGANISM="Scyphosphaera apsteinii, Strain RCC1455" /LENGTH=349 /DNA_ID=CAMNT_0007325033 /DNA_START=163 /DNA_END=1212 /DNA_ORIENTATION=+
MVLRSYENGDATRPSVATLTSALSETCVDDSDRDANEAHTLHTAEASRPDAYGWTLREQHALEAAMRAQPVDCPSTTERWRAIAASVPGRSVRECVQRCRVIAAAVRAALPPPLLRLDADVLHGVLEWLDGRALCACACVCRELGSAAHADALWKSIVSALPATWANSQHVRGDEPLWRYCLRMREGLYGAWRKLTEHRAGKCPYLHEIGTVQRGKFVPHKRLNYKITYGAICELVQIQAQLQGGISHRTYKGVAEQLVSLSANGRTAIPPDLHMTVREIYKTCYPGYGAATGSGAFHSGVQAGGSSITAATSGSMLGKGLVTMTKKMEDEIMRARLETRHEFKNLIPH